MIYSLLFFIVDNLNSSEDETHDNLIEMGRFLNDDLVGDDSEEDQSHDIRMRSNRLPLF